MTSTTLINYEPPNGPLRWVAPVQFESVSGGLTGCSLPDGRGVLMWLNGTSVRYAVLDSLAAARQNGVVTSASTAASANAVISCTVFTWGGQIYFTLLHHTSSTNHYAIAIYKANDPVDLDAGWSLQSMVFPGVNFFSGTNFSGNMVAGKPLITDSGRWIIAGPKAYQDLGTFFGHFRGIDARIWTSDNGAAGPWTERSAWTDFPGSIGPGHGADHCSGTLAKEPVTGRILAVGQTGTRGHTVDTQFSSSDGTSWSYGAYGGSDSHISPFVDNGTDVYAFNHDCVIVKLVGSTWTTWVGLWNSNQENPLNPGNNLGHPNNYGFNGWWSKAIVDSGKVWYFWGPFLGKAGRSWWAGEVGFNG